MWPGLPAAEGLCPWPGPGHGQWAAWLQGGSGPVMAPIASEADGAGWIGTGDQPLSRSAASITESRILT